MAAKTKRAKITLLKHVRIDGKHTEAGSTVEMDRNKATDLVSAGQAKFEDEDNEDERELEAGGEQFGVRIEAPTHGDPGPRVIEHARAIVKRHA